MERITWLEVEGVHYEALGDMLQCWTVVGFHSQLPGHVLDNLEVSDAQGRPLGLLWVDFHSGAMTLAPLASSVELNSNEIVVGDRLGAHIMGLDELAVSTGEPSASNMGTDTSYQEQVAGYSDGLHLESLTLACMVSSADETLDTFFGDAFFGESAGAVLPPAPGVEELSINLSVLYLEYGCEPSIMPLLLDPIAPSHSA